MRSFSIHIVTASGLSECVSGVRYRTSSPATTDVPKRFAMSGPAESSESMRASSRSVTLITPALRSGAGGVGSTGGFDDGTGRPGGVGDVQRRRLLLDHAGLGRSWRGLLAPGQWSTIYVGILLGVRQFRRGLMAVGCVVVLAIGGVVAFHALDDRRAPVALRQGVVVGQPTCLAPDVLLSVIPIPVQSPEPWVDPLPPVGTIPGGFQPTSVVVCEFLEYSDNGSSAILRQTLREGDLGPVVRELDRPSAERPWFSECPTASTIPTPVVWLVEAEGNAVRVAFPTEGTCGLPLAEAYVAVMGLAVQDEQLHYLPAAL